MPLRNATLDDIPEITDLWKKFMDFHFTKDSFFERRAEGHINFRDYLTENLTNPEFCITVVEEQHCIVGYAVARIEDYPPVFTEEKCAYITDIMLSEAYQSKGYGKALIEHIKDWAKGLNLHRIELHVLHNNTWAIEFYHRLGFEPFMQKLALKL